MIKKTVYTLSLLIACIGQSHIIFADNTQPENNDQQTNAEKKTDTINRTFDTVLINGLKICFIGQCIGYEMLKNVGNYFCNDFGTHYGNFLLPYAIAQGAVGVALLATPPLPVLLYWLKYSPSTLPNNP